MIGGAFRFVFRIIANIFRMTFRFLWEGTKFLFRIFFYVGVRFLKWLGLFLIELVKFIFHSLGALIKILGS